VPKVALPFRLSQFDVSRQRVKIAAEVDLPASAAIRLGRVPISRLDRARVMPRAGRAGSVAGKPAGNLENLPLVLGTTRGMLRAKAYYRQAVATTSRHRQQATRAILLSASIQAANVSTPLGFQRADHLYHLNALASAQCHLHS